MGRLTQLPAGAAWANRLLSALWVNLAYLSTGGRTTVALSVMLASTRWKGKKAVSHIQMYLGGCHLGSG